MKIINVKKEIIVLLTFFVISFVGFYNVNDRYIRNEKQIADLFEHATTCYEVDGNFDYAFFEMNNGLEAAFQAGAITVANVENVTTLYYNAGGNYKKLMEAYIPTMQANGWVSTSFSVSSTTATNSQANEQTSSTSNNSAEVTQNESSKSTDTNTEEVTVEESSRNTAETSKTTNNDENLNANDEWVESERKESTCTEAGYVVYTNASGEEKTEELSLVEHQYVETSRTAATCTETGSINYTCEVCGDTYSEEIPTIDHLLEEETVEAGLFTNGSKITKCSICGEVISEETIPAKCPTWVVIITIIAIVGIVGAIAFAVKKNVKIGAN